MKSLLNIEYMKKFTIDNSVFVKTILNEENVDIATDLMEYIEKNGHKIINPTLFQYEFFKVCITKNLNLKLAHEVIDRHLEVNMELLVPTIKHNQKAKEIIASCKKENGFPSYYDAIYHAIALENDGTFITADIKYYTKTKHLGGVLLLEKGMMEGVWMVMVWQVEGLTFESVAK